MALWNWNQCYQCYQHLQLISKCRSKDAINAYKRCALFYLKTFPSNTEWVTMKKPHKMLLIFKKSKPMIFLKETHQLLVEQQYELSSCQKYWGKSLVQSWCVWMHVERLVENYPCSFNNCAMHVDERQTLIWKVIFDLYNLHLIFSLHGWKIIGPTSAIESALQFELVLKYKYRNTHYHGYYGYGTLKYFCWRKLLTETSNTWSPLNSTRKPLNSWQWKTQNDARHICIALKNHKLHEFGDDLAPWSINT